MTAVRFYRTMLRLAAVREHLRHAVGSRCDSQAFNNITVALSLLDESERLLAALADSGQANECLKAARAALKGALAALNNPAVSVGPVSLRFDAEDCLCYTLPAEVLRLLEQGIGHNEETIQSVPRR